MVAHLSKFLIFFSVFLGLSSKTFLQFWIFLEMNMLSFLMFTFSLNYKMVSMKYFLIQSFFSSSLLLMYIFLCLYNYVELLKIFLMILLLGKLGIPPFFLWFINIMVLSNFEIIFFLSTWQKILPLFGGSSFFFNLEFVIFLTSIICILGSSTQLNFKKLLSFSSMFNMLWAFLVLENLFILFFFIFIYMISMLWVCSAFKDLKNKELISDLFFIGISEMQKIMCILSILALAGIPPFLMFNGKVLIMMYSVLFMMINSIWVLFLLFATLPIIYFYLRMMFYFSSRKKIIFSNSIFIMQNKSNYLFLNKFFSLLIFIL